MGYADKLVKLIDIVSYGIIAVTIIAVCYCIFLLVWTVPNINNDDLQLKMYEKLLSGIIRGFVMISFCGLWLWIM